MARWVVAVSLHTGNTLFELFDLFVSSIWKVKNYISLWVFFYHYINIDAFNIYYMLFHSFQFADVFF